MKEKQYNREQERNLRHQEIYRLRILEGEDISSIGKKFGLSRGSVYYALTTFEEENPQQAELMKKQGKDVTPEDYKKLQEEIGNPEKGLPKNACVLIFNEEMVVFRKRSLWHRHKKVGTK